MPWEIKKDGDQFCVVEEGTETKVPGGCHDTEQKAKDHMAALYANVEDASRGTFTSLSERIATRVAELTNEDR